MPAVEGHLLYAVMGETFLFLMDHYIAAFITQVESQRTESESEDESEGVDGVGEAKGKGEARAEGEAASAMLCD